VFVGNCQIQAIHGLYQRYATQSAAETLRYVKSYESIEAADRAAIEQADVLVEQVQDFKSKADLAGIVTNARKIGVPVVHCGFLWPFAGQPHPANPTPAFHEGGPYGAEMSDAFLNRLIKKGVDPATAVKTYLELDINKTVNLDRLLEMVLEKQETRDKLTDFKITPVIAGFYKTEPVFLTPYHPNLRIAMALASQALERLDVPNAEIEQMRTAVQITPFPKEELPVHPGVARHFGLEWASEDRRYRFLSEGRFTFQEFATRYMTCEWNPDLQEGLDLVRRKELHAARSKLTQALEKTPNSAPGYGALSSVLLQLNEPKAAMEAIQTALSLDFESASHHLHRGILLNQAGEGLAAEREYRVAAALEPFDSHFPGMLAHFLSSKKRYAEARAVAVHGIVCVPRAANLHSILGHVAQQMGYSDAAAAEYKREAELAPQSIDGLLGLARIYQDSNRDADAVGVLREAMKRAPSNPRVHGQLALVLDRLGEKSEAAEFWAAVSDSASHDRHQQAQAIHFLMQGGKYDQAIDAARRALEEFPGDPDFSWELASSLERVGRIAEALAVVDKCINAHPGDVKLAIRYADLLMRSGDLAQAEAAYRKVVVLNPNNAHAFGQLGHVLNQQKRYDEAIAARETACNIEPNNAPRRAQLGHVLLSAGRIEEAGAAIRAAIAGEPNHAAFHVDLAHVLERAGRSEEAIEAVVTGLKLDAHNARAHGFLGHLLFKVQKLDQAELEYRKAVELAPSDVHWQVQLVRVLAAQSKSSDAQNVADQALLLEPTNAFLKSHASPRTSRLAIAG
jgi:tetratricopeptide (TPR) repeat protein